MSKSTYTSGYYAAKNIKQEQLADIRRVTDEYWDNRREKEAKTAKSAENTDKFHKMALKVANDVELRRRSSLYTTQQVHHTVPDPNAAFRRKKGKESGRASVHRHLASMADRAKEIGELYHNPGPERERTYPTYIGAGPGKVWNDEEERWEDEDGSLQDIEEGDIPR